MIETCVCLGQPCKELHNARANWRLLQEPLWLSVVMASLSI